MAFKNWSTFVVNNMEARRSISGAVEDLGPSELFVKMQTYHADARRLVGFFIGACFSTVAANQYMTDVQLKGMEGKLEGKLGKLDGKIGKLEGRIGALEEKINTLEANMEAHLKDIKRDLQSLCKKCKN